MKKLLLLLILCGMVANVQAQRRIKTVNNDPLAPGQYTTIAAAITAATAGDTIYIGGSATSYGDISVTKKLTFMGTAHSPDDQFDLKPTIGKITMTAAAAGSTFIGLYISQNDRLIEASNDTHNISFKKCYLFSQYDYIFSVDNCDNWLIEGCIIVAEDGIGLTVNSDNIVLKNNYLYTANRTITGANSTTLIFNNLFNENWIGKTQFESCYNATLYNNIFYYRNATANYAPDDGCFSCNFSYNLTYAPNLAVEAKVLANIPGAANLGGNNLNNIDPMLLAIDGLTDNDCRPADGSPAKNAGSDGTDIGLFGANYNFTIRGYTNIPQIYQLNIQNTVLPLNGTLNVNLKARKQD